jgi:hypothetical protein
MSNMSYCRFENTLADLRDCYENWDSKLENESEVKARARMLKLCKDIVDDYGDDE